MWIEDNYEYYIQTDDIGSGIKLNMAQKMKNEIVSLIITGFVLTTIKQSPKNQAGVADECNSKGQTNTPISLDTKFQPYFWVKNQFVPS